MSDSSMQKFHKLIKEIALKAVEASAPVKVLFGTVESVSPLAVRVEQKLLLPEEFFIQTAAVQGLQPGDRLVLMQVQGGQSFLIFDKVVA